MRDILPTIQIPLCHSDDDVQLELQTAIHRLYDAAGYGNYIYTGKPHPSLPPDDAKWAKELLPAKS